MLEFFKKKEYISCKYLEYGIHFDTSGIFHCANYFHSDLNNSPIVPLINQKYDINKFLKIKKRHKKYIKDGNILPCSINCFEREKKAWDNKIILKEIAISANSTCNSDCIYCATHPNKKFCNSFPNIPVYEIIQELFKKNLIDKNCDIQFGGGEPLIHFEFEKLLKLFIDNTNSLIRIHSSGIKYSESIEELIKLSRCMLVISVDSGNRELYKKIKNVDKFDNVIENIRKYCIAQAQSSQPNQVAPKYIIIPGVNDNEHCISEFINLMKELGCNNVRSDIENNWYKRHMHNSDDFKPIFKLFHFIESEAEKNGLKHFYNATSLDVIKKYPDLYN